MRKATIVCILVLLIIQPLTIFAQDTNYRFTGQEFDSEMNLHNFKAREYSSETGRFLQQDPVLKDGEIDNYFLSNANQEELNKFLSDPQRLNPYSYANNNPVRYTDPTGMFNWDTGQVESGDNLYNVFGNNWKEVSNYNNLENPNLIFPGQHLNVPEFAQKTFWQNVSDVATAFLPILSDIRDGIESVTKRDMITGRLLTPGEEDLTSAGTLAIGLLSGRELRGLNKIGNWLKLNIGEKSDWVRWGNTHIPKEVAGANEDKWAWAIKGGGVNKDTGFKLPFHYHIHKYNWNKPWTWFDNK